MMWKRSGRRQFFKGALGSLLSLPFLGKKRASASEGKRDYWQGGLFRQFRVAAIASRCWPASPERNLESCATWVEKARQQGANLVAFPELSVTGYLTTPEIWRVAEPVPGPSTARLEEIARRSETVIAAGIAEKDKDIVYDTYVFVGPAGYIGKSRKMHIPIPEVGYWRGGGVPPVIDIGLARVGVNICFDNWLPESSRLVGLGGAEILFAPYVWDVGPWGTNPNHSERNRAWKDYASRTFPARAIDNGMFMIAVNACGTTPNGAREYHGNPIVMIYSPLGELIAESPDDASDETMVVTDLDPELIAKRRSQGHFHLRFRRPELYGSLAEATGDR
jgi:N-carbamoylputrescine amidase